MGAGVTLVGQTGTALESIIGKVSEIDGLIVDIAAAANNQATGIGEVNAAMGEMDRMTQQNAAMVEEATAATQVLQSETAELARLIAVFKVGATSGVAPMPVRNRPTSLPNRSLTQGRMTKAG